MLPLNRLPSSALVLATVVSLWHAVEPNNASVASPQWLPPAEPELNAFLPPCFKRLDGIDIPGNDIGSSQGALDSCDRACATKKGCRAWTWNGYNDGTCWLKSGWSTGTYKAGVVTAFKDKYVCDDRLVVQLQNCGISGNDMGSSGGVNYDACIDQCVARPGCRAFTWTDYQGGTCWFKSHFSGCQYAANKFSAVRPWDIQ